MADHIDQKMRLKLIHLAPIPPIGHLFIIAGLPVGRSLRMGFIAFRSAVLPCHTRLRARAVFS